MKGNYTITWKARPAMAHRGTHHQAKEPGLSIDSGGPCAGRGKSQGSETIKSRQLFSAGELVGGCTLGALKKSQRRLGIVPPAGDTRKLKAKCWYNGMPVRWHTGMLVQCTAGKAPRGMGQPFGSIPGHVPRIPGKMSKALGAGGQACKDSRTSLGTTCQWGSEALLKPPPRTGCKSDRQRGLRSCQHFPRVQI